MDPLDLAGSYLVLDLGNACPLRCGHCIQSEAERHDHFRSRGTMDTGLALDLLDELQDAGRRFHALMLFWLGEPLLHPDIVPIYRRAIDAVRAGVFRRVELHTNAVLLDEEIAAAVADSPGGEQRWHLSLDAATPETYRAVKGRDVFHRVEANVERLLDQRRARGNDDLTLAFQFIPQRRNASEARAFVARWRRALARRGRTMEVHARAIPEGAGDCVFLRQLDALRPREQRAANGLYERVLEDVGLARRPSATRRALERLRRLAGARGGAVAAATGPVPCACPFLSPVVRWDGEVTVCTRDSGMTLAAGDLREASFHEIWWESPSLGALRRAHMEGRAGGLCRGCPIPRSANYTGLDPADLERYRRSRRVGIRR